MKLIKKICCLSSFIFIVFTLTSCIGIGPNGIILPKKKRIYKSLNDYLEITVPKIDEVLDYYYGGDHLPPFDSTSCDPLRAIVILDKTPADIVNMLGNEKMVMKKSSERFEDCTRRGDFGKYVSRAGIPYYMKDGYKEILKNSCNYYWTFYYENHHSNGDTIFFMGIYLPDYNYLYLYEYEYPAKNCQNVEYN